VEFARAFEGKGKSNSKGPGLKPLLACSYFRGLKAPANPVEQATTKATAKANTGVSPLSLFFDYAQSQGPVEMTDWGLGDKSASGGKYMKRKFLGVSYMDNHSLQNASCQSY
jgi:hypothetical protein